jgi:hypothetical protein
MNIKIYKIIISIRMNRYSNRKVYGIRWNIYDGTDNLIKKFEKIYLEKTKGTSICEIQVEYNKLSEYEKNEAKISYYTCCNTIYKSGPLMLWYQMDRNALEDFFSKEK